MYKNVHSTGEERNVGSFNYPSTVRGGRKFLESASRHVAVKSSRLVWKCFSERIQKIPKPFSRYSGNQGQMEWKNAPASRKMLQRKRAFKFKK